MYQSGDRALIRAKRPLSRPGRRRRINRPATFVLLPLLLAGCGGRAPTPTTAGAAAPTSVAMATTNASAVGHSSVRSPEAEAVWREQAKSWLKVHSADLTAISTASKGFGDAVKAGDVKSTAAAISEFMVEVGRTKGDLPANEFGHDLETVLNDYGRALAMIQTGIVTNDQHSLAAGSSALSVAVAEFGVVAARVKATP